MNVRVWGVLLSVLLLATAGFAQISLNMDDFSIHPYTELTRGMGANFNQMTVGGPDQTWDFSSSITVVDYVETWDEPTGHHGAADFPTANLVWFGPMVENQQQLIYYHRTATSYNIVGAAYYIAPNVITISAATTGLLMSCPLSYGDEWDFQMVTEYEGTTTTEDMHFTVDAWGTLTDLNGSYECLRLRVDRAVNEQPSGEEYSAIEYAWYRPGWGEMVKIKSNYDETDPQFSSGTFERIIDVVTAVNDPDPQLVHTFELLPAYPNPFNAMTMLSFTLDAPGEVTVSVLNALGQQVAAVAQASFNAGSHQVAFDANGLASGTYFVQLIANGNTRQLQKITLLK